MAHKAKMLLLVLHEHVYEHRNKRRHKMSSGVLSFKYGRYGTETASTVVIGDAESVGAQVYRLLFRIPLLLLLYLLPRTAKVRICHHIRIRTVYQTHSRTKEAE